MMDTDRDFEARLLATFREEADEHLAEITQDLLALEKAGPDTAGMHVEQAYRKTHSLKGAARAVRMREIESVCQNLETVFAAMKRGEYTADAEAFDTFHEALRAARALLSEEKGAVTSITDINRRIRLISADLKSSGQREARTIPPCPGPVAEDIPKEPPAIPPVSSGTPALQGARAGPERGTRGGGTDAITLAFPMPDTRTVRVASEKLDRLISGSDDLLTTRLFIAHRMQELEEMVTRFGIWRWNNTLVSTDLHHLRELSFGKQRRDLPPDLVLPLQRVVEFLEYNREFVTSLQHDLGTHIRDTELDRSALEASTQTISDLIHDAVLLPVGSVLMPFTGIVREYSRRTGKQVDLFIEGGTIDMDRRILEALKDPIMHLVYNAIDHGIEYPDIREEKKKAVRGIVRIRAVPLSGSKINIEVSDDGAGIDAAAIRRIARDRNIISGQEAETLADNEILWLVFHSGLSTSPVVTDLSGRGLGLAIVEDTATRLGGTVSIASAPNAGTTIRITVPIRLATMQGVVVRAGNSVYVIPKQQVRQVMRVRPDAIRTDGGRPALFFAGEMITTIRLTDALGVMAADLPGARQEFIQVIILAYGAGQIACMVDEIVRVQEIVVRPLGTQLRRVRRITGAVILGDGTLALVLDPIELIQETLKGNLPQPIRIPRRQVEARNVLVVEDSVTSRTLLQTILERGGYRVQTATDGMEAFAILKQNKFDIVVSDIDMPRMNGFLLTEKIRADEKLARIPVVLVTSLDSPEDKNHGLAVGADAYIVKSSFDRTGLLDIIARIFEQAKHGRNT